MRNDCARSRAGEDRPRPPRRKAPEFHAAALHLRAPLRRTGTRNTLLLSGSSFDHQRSGDRPASARLHVERRRRRRRRRRQWWRLFHGLLRVQQRQRWRGKRRELWRLDRHGWQRRKRRERRYSEYWTLVRGSSRKGVPRVDPTCPNCGAELKVNMTGSCEFCAAKVTAGEFDWVLSRIEQDEAYEG